MSNILLILPPNGCVKTPAYCPRSHKYFRIKGKINYRSGGSKAKGSLADIFPKSKHCCFGKMVAEELCFENILSIVIFP